MIIDAELERALPDLDGALRAAVWELMRPMLSPVLGSLNVDAFVVGQGVATTVDLGASRSISDLDDLDLAPPDERSRQRRGRPAPA